MYRPVALCARNVSRQLVRFVACRSLPPLLIWTCFATLCSVASCFSCSSYVQAAIWFPLKTPASVKHSVPLHMVFDVFVCCPLVPRKTNIVPALVPVARACPSVIFQHLKRMLKDLTVPLEGPLPGVDVSRTVQPKLSVVSRTSLFLTVHLDSLCTLAMFQQQQAPRMQVSASEGVLDISDVAPAE